jgi:hypothetical protein
MGKYEKNKKGGEGGDIIKSIKLCLIYHYSCNFFLTFSK